MLIKITIGDTIPQFTQNFQVHPIIYHALQTKFQSNTTYFTNGEILVIANVECMQNFKFDIQKQVLITIKKIARIPLTTWRNDIIIWKSWHSFHQNNLDISRQFYQYMNKLLLDLSSNIISKNQKWNLLGFGGDFISYFVGFYLTFARYDLTKPCQYVAITNSEHIYQDAIFNSKIYHLDLDVKKIDYNRISQYPNNVNSEKPSLVIIQMAKINQETIKYILVNQKLIQIIVIIACHLDDYMKKTSLLHQKYKMIKSKYFDNKSGGFLGIYVWYHKNF
jgi:hypothetical protein